MQTLKEFFDQERQEILTSKKLTDSQKRQLFQNIDNSIDYLRNEIFGDSDSKGGL